MAVELATARRILDFVGGLFFIGVNYSMLQIAKLLFDGYLMEIRKWSNGCGRVTVQTTTFIKDRDWKRDKQRILKHG